MATEFVLFPYVGLLVSLRLVSVNAFLKNFFKYILVIVLVIDYIGKRATTILKNLYKIIEHIKTSIYKTLNISALTLGLLKKWQRLDCGTGVEFQ